MKNTIPGKKDISSEAVELKQELKSLIRTLPDAVAITDIPGNITAVSQQTLILHGYQQETELIGKELLDLIAPESKAHAIIYLHKIRKEGAARNIELTFIKKNGQKFVGELNAAVYLDGADNSRKIITATRDLTARKSADLQLMTSLKEKELLLQEIHHRVKNNLQIISSLLDLTTLRIRDSKAIHLIDDARSKIQSMAFIHSQLYKSERFDKIEMGSHVQQLISYLSDVYGSQKNITPHINIADIYLSLTQAMPCALVMNELISNAYKHAFKPGEKGVIEIDMKISKGNQIVISIRDNGKGFSSDFDLAQTESLGLKLVRNLVERQLKGVVKLSKKNYTEFILKFKIQDEEAKHA